jgi:hypothetical protein
MDYYGDFAAALGEATRYREPSVADLLQAETDVSPAYRKILENDGLASYKQNLLWSVLPSENEAIAKQWQIDGLVGKIFLRTCFGDFFAWHGSACWLVNINEHVAIELIDDMEWFFSAIITDRRLLTSLSAGSKKKPHRSIINGLTHNTVAAWEPPLATGGSRAQSCVLVRTFAQASQALSQLGDLRLRRY